MEKPKISRKQKQILIYILVGFLTAIIIFIAVLVYGIHSRRKGKVLDTLELPKSTLRRIINLEKRYNEKNSQYVSFGMGVSCRPIGFEQPSWSEDSFDYSFDAKTGIAKARERSSEYDVNGDEDGDDGLTFSIDGTRGVIKGSKGNDLFWD